jgi:hypothetical protein
MISKDGTDKMGECVQLRIDPEDNRPNQVLWEALGLFITFVTDTAEDAEKLYEALLAVKEVESD